jgi:hypothetical protein
LSASRPGRFTPGRAAGNHWIRGWVDPRAGLDEVEKILDPTGTRNSDLSVVQPVASRYIDYAILEALTANPSSPPPRGGPGCIPW